MNHPMARAAALALGLALASPGLQAATDMTDWIYFSMYPNDTAHAVHLGALQWRDDGLLASASRYPRTSPHPWAEAQSKRGWYDYFTRLIDCESGMAIDTGRQLLGRDGQTIARRDVAASVLAEWKQSLERRLPRAWPDNSEHFLACAGAADETLVARRAQIRATPPPPLSYTPLVATLREDSSGLIAQRTWQPEDTVVGDVPSPAAVFDALRASHEAWLAAFHGTTMWPAPRPPQAAMPDSATAWLDARGADFDALTSAGDGTVTYADRAPSRYDLPTGTLDAVPEAARGARDALLTVRVDCRSGVHVPQRLMWRDRAGKDLAEQPLDADAVARDAIKRARASGARGTNVLAPPPMDDKPRLACLAAAAVCAGRTPDAPPDFAVDEALQAAVNAATTAEAALRATRAAWRAYRQYWVPSCRIGSGK